MSKQIVPSFPQRHDEPEPSGTESHVAAEEQSSSRPSLLRLLPEAPLVIVAVALFVIARGFDAPADPGELGPAFWPQMLCIGLVVCASIGLGQKLRGRGVAATAPVQAHDDLGDEPEVSWRKVALGIALISSYALGMVFLGYVLATALFFVAFAYLGGQRRWYVVPIGVAATLLFAFVFLRLVYISLPSGVGVFDQFSVVVYTLLGIY